MLSCISVQRASQKGFTLVEAMVVMVIVAILSSVAFASFGNWFARNRVNGAARQLHTELHTAKMKAIAENNTYRVDFDINNNVYTIYGAGTVSNAITIGSYYEDIVFGFITGTTAFGGGAISSSVTFSGSTVTFNPNGLSSQAGTIYLMPLNETRAKMQRSIDVNLVGRIKYRTHNGSNWE